MEKNNIREPVVAGSFYPSSADSLTKQIESFIDKNSVKSDVVACMLPHAGYMYSGRVAVQTASRINFPDKVVIIGPNHTGYGAAYSIQTEGIWQLPFGQVKIDSNLAKCILSNSRYLKQDSDAHRYEHSIEVEIPILQYFKKNFEIVPICILSEDVDALKEIGNTVAGVIKQVKLQGSVLIIASSDLTHYQPQQQASKKDKEAIEAIINLDVDKLNEKVKGLGITMCGSAPVSVMLVAAKALGAKRGELVRYETSGDVTGQTDSVVGYAGILLH